MALSQARIQAMIQEIQKDYSWYKGWNFEVEPMMGTFCYSKNCLFNDDEWTDVFFTPEFHGSCEVNFQISNEQGEMIYDAEKHDFCFRWDRGLSVRQLIFAVHNLIDEFEGRE